MSKTTFSEKISGVMSKKITAIDSLNLFNIFEKDEDFEIAICLAYLTLSKEKIVEKDIKNDDRLGRLTSKVDTTEIDKVFKPGFAPQMPNIIYARENNNLWILDNIRDSIMHGACDIDETKKCFIINNTQYNRELTAEIPFSWFIAYAKNDILSKKISNNYTIKKYYYNQEKKNFSNFETKKELVNNILYRVNISGNQFNISKIENRITELFLEYSNDKISDETIQNYKEQISKEKIKYNEKYLVSFYETKQKVLNTLNKEYPDLIIDIFIDNRKHHFVNRATKNLPKYFTNYDLMFNNFNNTLSPKGISLLKIITNIIDNFDNNQIINENKPNDWKTLTKNIHKILTNENILTDKTNDLQLILNKDLKTLQSIYLNIFGLSTLVINHETLYNSYFLNRNPQEFGIRAQLKRPYLEYAQKRKNLIMKVLDIEITLSQKISQLNKCLDPNAKQKIQTTINGLNNDLTSINNDLINLMSTTGFEHVIKQNEINHQNSKKISNLISQYFGHFDKATNVKDKRKIKKVIGKLFDLQIEEESRYTYGYCQDMKEVLTIIRNCFSHIGRIHIGKNNVEDSIVILNDYDNDGEKSGEIFCKYGNLIELLKEPYQFISQTPNTK